MIETKLFLLALAVLLVVGSVNHWRRARRAAGSRVWPRTTATIERSEIVKDRVGSQNMRVYVPHVEYTFEVNGRRFRGATITDGADGWYTGNPAHARARLAQYPVGVRVPVYYDPRRPQDSCLERAEGSLAMGYAIPAILLAGGTLVGGLVLASW